MHFIRNRRQLILLISAAIFLALTAISSTYWYYKHSEEEAGHLLVDEVKLMLSVFENLSKTKMSKAGAIETLVDFADNKSSHHQEYLIIYRQTPSGFVQINQSPPTQMNKQFQLELKRALEGQPRLYDGLRANHESAYLVYMESPKNSQIVVSSQMEKNEIYVGVFKAAFFAFVFVSVSMIAISFVLLKVSNYWLVDLEAQKNRIQAILDNSPAMIYMKDSLGRLDLANKIFSEMYENAIQSPLEKEKFSEGFTETELKVVSQKKIVAQEEIWFDSKNNRFVFEAIYFPIYMDKNIIGVGQIAFDITEQELAKQLAAKNAIRYQSIFNNDDLGIMVVDLESVQVIEANNRVLKMFAGELQVNGNLLELFNAYAITYSDLDSLFRFLEDSRNSAIEFSRNGLSAWFEISHFDCNVTNSVCALLSFKAVTDSVLEQEKLKHNQTLLNDAQRIAQIGHWEWHIQTGSLVWSQEILRIFDVDGRDFEPTYEAFLSFLPKEDQENVQKAIDLALQGEKPYSIYHRVITSTGEEKFVHERGTIYRDKEGNPERMIGTVHDITQRMEQEKQIRLFVSAIEHNPVGMAIIDKTGVTQYVNTRFVVESGLQQSDVIGFAIVPFLRHMDKKLGDRIEKALNSFESWEDALQINSSDIIAEKKVKQFGVYPINYTREGYTHFLLSITDVSRQKQAEEKVWVQANYDSLTNVANRMRFHDQLENMLHRAKRKDAEFAIMYIDLDDFKPVNDSFGHDYGDKVLKEVAYRLKSIIKRQTDLVARLGGDEFAVILENFSDLQTLASLAQTIVNSLSAPYFLDSNNILISCSIGIAIYPTDGVDKEILLGVADENMYKAKQNGRNTFVLQKSPSASDSVRRIG
ncbi:MAG: diguanylate cyclase [Gammaproteobacteria bacterium]|nr:diguanylate cyclase [Gammaproteobacteria bacterium]